MAFICTIKLTSFRADIFQRGADILINSPIGYDDCRPLNYSLLVGLSPAGGGTYEFFFVIVEIDGDNNSETEIWDSQFVSKIISVNDRAKVKILLLNITENLFRTHRPDVFSMATYLPSLSDRVLEKYQKLCQIFVSAGYIVTEADPYQGHRMWWAERGL